MKTPDSHSDPEETPSDASSDATANGLLAKLPELLSDLVVGLLGLILFIFAPGEWMGERASRVWVCIALAFAAGVMVQWIIADRVLGHILFVIVVVLGIAIGIVWERRA